MPFALHRLLLRQLQVNSKRAISSQSCTVKLRSDSFKSSTAQFIPSRSNENLPLMPAVTLTLRSLTFEPNFRNGEVNISKIIKCPILNNLRIVEPPRGVSLDLEDIDNFPNTSLELPTVGETLIEKQAARLIVIRKKKMKKHKLKKLRKKMKFEWAKLRQRRKIRKEKLFQAELLAQIKQAEQFDAASYVAEKIRKATEVPIPRLWKGKRLPEFIIREKLGLPKKGT